MELLLKPRIIDMNNHFKLALPALLLLALLAFVQAQDQAAPTPDQIDPIVVNPSDPAQPQQKRQEPQPEKVMTAEEARRTQKYKAEQERIKEIRRRQQEAQQRRRQEMGNQENVQFQSDGRISKTEQIQKNEMEQIHSFARQQSIDTKFSPASFMFQTLSSVEEYAFEIPDDMEFMLRMTIYIEENNIYGYVKDVDAAQPLKVYVYEDNTQIVGQAEFYFDKIIVFQVKKGSIYTVRFYNTGMKKLVNVYHPKIIAQQHIENLYDGSKGAQHMKKGQMLSSKITNTLRELRRSSALDYMNSKNLQDALNRFSYFQYVEILVVVIITVTQVQLIKKMFKTESIL